MDFCVRFLIDLFFCFDVALGSQKNVSRITLHLPDAIVHFDLYSVSAPILLLQIFPNLNLETNRNLKIQ